MKALLEKLVPVQLINFYKRKLKPVKFRNKSIKETFVEIYETNHWQGNESISGRGSDSDQTAKVIVELEKIFINYNIKSVLDVPCGDFNWMSKINFSTVQYLGADIVPQIIERNKLKYAHLENIDFKCIDLTTDAIGKSDLIICRDCLVHMSNDAIKKAIQNMVNSDSKYLITTSYVNRTANYDIVTGDWRPINLEIPPFNFPKPIYQFIEECTEGNGKYTDKAMCMWEVKALRNLINL